MHKFSIEISVEHNGKIVSLDTDDMDINIYHYQDGEMKRVVEITCNDVMGNIETVIQSVVENTESEVIRVCNK